MRAYYFVLCRPKRLEDATGGGDGGDDYEDEDEDVQDDFSLHQAIQHCQLVREVEKNLMQKSTGSTAASVDAREGDDYAPPAKRRKEAEESYFSDED